MFAEILFLPIIVLALALIVFGVPYCFISDETQHQIWATILFLFPLFAKLGSLAGWIVGARIQSRKARK